MNGSYQTRCGFKVELQGMIQPPYPVVGRYLGHDSQWHSLTWTRTGHFVSPDSPSPLDLVAE
jgi:hypothetical protein